MRPITTIFSVRKVTESGMGQRFGMQLLREAGIKAERAHSPYIGDSGILVYGGKRVQDRASRILYR